MNRQKSFENNNQTLFLVPTPIGNLSEMTPRAIEVLNSVDIIACEDTRNSGQLLKYFNIKKKLIAYENFNEVNSCKGIIKLLEEGNNVALISDAGYPLINDPGQRVVSEAVDKGFNVVSISGCNAMLNGLVASGLIVQTFIFIGFLPSGNTDCLKKLEEYKKYPMTMVFYEAPHRIKRMMENCLQVLGDRKCCIARELTKLHEEYIRGTISEVIEVLDDIKGEMVVIVEGNNEIDTVSDDDIITKVNELVSINVSKKDAIKRVAKELNINKNYVYDLVNKVSNNG